MLVIVTAEDIVSTDSFYTYTAREPTFLHWLRSIMTAAEAFGLTHIDSETLIFDSTLPFGKLGQKLIDGFGNNDQVVSIEKLPWTACSKFTRQCFHNYDEE